MKHIPHMSAPRLFQVIQAMRDLRAGLINEAEYQRIACSAPATLPLVPSPAWRALARRAGLIEQEQEIAARSSDA